MSDAEQALGLRERKKQRTRRAISDAALRLFLARGFDAVSVADVAAAAEVSRPTLFKYFPTKENLLLDRFADHREESARVVRDRPAGTAPLPALHRHYRELLDTRDPSCGLSDLPDAVALRRVVYGTPSLAAHLLAYAARGEQTLAAALTEAGGSDTDALTARLAAAAIVSVQLTLSEDNWRQVAEGRGADELYPQAVRAADHAFDLLTGGLATHYG